MTPFKPRRHGWLLAILLYQYRVPEASVLFMAAFLISATLGVVRQVLFNAQFGAGMEASAFYAAYRLPETLSLLIAGGTLSNALIPVLAQVSRNEGQAAEVELANLVLTSFLAFLCGIALLAGILAPQFINTILAPGFDQPASALTAALTRIMLLQALIGLVVSVGMAVLNSRQQFTLSGLAIIVHNIAMISGILIVRVVPGLGIYGPTLGVVVDGLLQLLILIPGLWLNQVHFRYAWNTADRRLRQVVALLIPNGLSAVVNYGGTIVDTAYASLARESVALPALQNALLVIGFPIRLFGIAIGQAAFPRLASQVVAHDWPRLRGTLLRALGVAWLLALPVMVILLVWGRTLIKLVLERGAFTAEAGNLTAALVAAYAIALPAYIATEILSRGLIAMHDTTTPLFTNIGQLIGRLLIINMLLDSTGALAIPIAFAVSSTGEALALGLVLWRRLHKRRGHSETVAR